MVPVFFSLLFKMETFCNRKTHVTYNHHARIKRSKIKKIYGRFNFGGRQAWSIQKSANNMVKTNEIPSPVIFIHIKLSIVKFLIT